MRKILVIIFLPMLMALSAQAALANKRVALIIGNSTYRNISPLDNPANDAALMQKTLREVGFKVIVATDADYNGMRRAIRDFGRELRGSGKDAVGLFYYAGHGVQSKGRNYLIPIGAEISDEADLSIEAISTGHVLDQMEGAGNKLNLVILDSCRNNPFKGVVRSGTRGLARIDTASGTLVAFAAAPGQVATDGRGENSPYTAALAEFIKTPNLTVEQVFKKVRNRVEEASFGKQTPWEESSLRGEFYFIGKSIDATVQSSQPAEPSEGAFELAFWETIKTSQNPKDYEAYLKAYPEGRFSMLAKIRINRLKKQDQAAVTATPAAKIANPSAADPPVHQCDRLAAAPADPNRKSQGVAWVDFQKRPQPAVEACRRAVSAYPGVARFEMQFGRALHADKTYAEALRWYRKAVEKGQVPAIYNLGLMYALGTGVTRDDAEAVRWFRKATEKGYVPAMNNLGVMYARGTGVTRDDAEALRWYRKAAEKGYATAMNNLGFMYTQGNGVARDDAEAMRWYRKAVEKDYVPAMFNLGVIYEQGRGVARDDAEAVRWYRKAAEKGTADAMYNLGAMYARGKGVARDDVEAVRWYLRAAENDHAKSMYNVGVAYERGIGVSRDYGESVRWYRKAADAGDAQGMGNLGGMYNTGRGVVRDNAEAARLIAQALRLGDEYMLDQMTTNSSAWGREFRLELQRILKSDGAYEGAIDGSFGPATEKAIRKLAGKS